MLMRDADAEIVVQRLESWNATQANIATALVVAAEVIGQTLRDAPPELRPHLFAGVMDLIAIAAETQETMQ